MDDKDWEDEKEFWDDEQHGDVDDDDYNGLGNDVDANNDETFDNAAEWNEDEHEELIARDLLLSHKAPAPKQPAVQQPPAQQQLPTPPQPQVLTVDELERQLLRTSINQNAQQPRAPRVMAETSRRAGWSPFGGKDIFKREDDIGLFGSPSLLDSNLFQNIEPKTSMLEQQQRLILQQQQRLILQQQQLLQQHQQNQQQQQQQQQHHHQQQQHQQHQNQHHMNKMHDQNLQQHHFAFLAHHRPQQQPEPKTTPVSVRCFTVEELERQMLASRHEAAAQRETDTKRSVGKASETSNKAQRNHDAQRQHFDEPRNGNFHEKRNGERQDRYDRSNRDNPDTRDHYRERRDNRNHKENYRSYRKGPNIIPPQVQLSVISRAKRRHSITAMHHDEFIRDRMPASGEGFRFLRHSQVASSKMKHDGVLTDKERDWLTRIQEKIQADYDNNLDQDYYYLLYFNKSSMTDEAAAQKPSGQCVPDRRFIPRERLLYNSGV